VVVATAAALGAGAFGTAATAAGDPGAWVSPSPSDTFHRLATYPVYLNRPAGAPAADPTVAEISAVSEDGNTFIHTDALAHRIGFVDITDPGNPVGKGTLDLDADLGLPNASPTSVAVIGGYVLVVVDTSDYASDVYDFETPADSVVDRSGVLVVVDLATQEAVTTIDLEGQPDSIAVTPDKKHAAIAIENQRDEEGDIDPGVQPAGFLQLVDTSDPNPENWSADPIDLVGDAVYDAAADDLAVPEDPEPEYVSVNPSGTKIALTLQENNGVVIIDVATAGVEKVWSAGTDSISGIDTAKDGVIDQTGSITDVPREPDAIGWIDDTHVATANEGDWNGGTRGWTIFDLDGAVVWDAGASIEDLATRVGLHNEDRAGKKGPEIEGLAVEAFGGKRYAFVGSERSNFVAVYDVSAPASPAFVQVLATTNGPEGILPVPSRDLLLVSSEEDDSDVRVRSSVSIYGRGEAFADRAGTPEFPSVVSALQDGKPIGWGALGALTADLSDPTHLWSATDAAYDETHLLSLDVSTTPAVIDRAVLVTKDGAPVAIDAEGITSRPQGGFWLGNEGATGAANSLVRVDADGAVQQEVPVPADVAAGLTKWGIEGVAVQNDDAGEHVWVALQRGLTTDAGGLQGAARIGRYDVSDGSWAWFLYPLEAPSPTSETVLAGQDWMGLSEITVVDDHTLAVIERDKLNGPDAKVKRIYTVQIPATDPAAGTVPTLTKTLAHDVLPDLQATRGWTQEKLEGLTIGGDGDVYVVTDNDALADATGETVLLDLGSKASVFGASSGGDDEGDGDQPGGDEGDGPDGPQSGGVPAGAGDERPDPALHTATEADLTAANHGGITVPGTLSAGGTFTLRAGGYLPGEWVQVLLFSTPTELAWARADAQGDVTATVTIPASVPAGTHRLALVGQVDGAVRWVEVQVLAAPDGDLASTGADGVGMGLLAGTVLLAAGTAGVVVARRRRSLPRVTA